MSVLQKRLLLALAALLVLQAGAETVKYFIEIRGGGRFGGDFIAFWNAARHAYRGEIAAIYAPDAWRHASAAAPAWFVYPPLALLGLWPLGALSYDAGVAWWVLCPLPFYFALLYALARRSGLGAGRPFFLLAASSLPLVMANLFTAQTGALIAALFMAARLCWRRRPWLAGVFIGLMAVKPQLGLLAPVALLAAGRWRTIGSAAATVLLLAGAATAWLGPAIWLDYLAMTRIFAHAIGSHFNAITLLALGPYVSLQAAGAPAALAGAVQVVATLAVAALVFTTFRDARRDTGPGGDGRDGLRFGILAAGALLATPHSTLYDTPLLAVALAPLWARIWRCGFDAWDFAAIVLVAILPSAQLALAGFHLPFSLLATATALGVLYRRYWRGAADARRSDNGVGAIPFAGPPEEI
jgi:hypothetical protein